MPQPVSIATASRPAVARLDRTAAPASGPIGSRQTIVVLRGDTFSGPAANEIAMVDSGRLSLTVTTLNAAEFRIRQLKPGDIVIPLDLIADPAITLLYRSEEDARVSWLRGRSATLPGATDAERVLLHATADVLAGCIRMIQELTCLPAPHRLYCELLRLAGRHATLPFTVPPHAILAARLCTTRETISRELSFLRRNGVIAGGKDIRIVNPDFLLSRIAAALRVTEPDAVWQAIGTPRS